MNKKKVKKSRDPLLDYLDQQLVKAYERHKKIQSCRFHASIQERCDHCGMGTLLKDKYPLFYKGVAI